jgi:hypothetical protein
VLLEQPQCTSVTPGARHFTIFEDLCRKAAVGGNLVQDAWFAALALESGCEWITTDGDFARFPGLRWRRPFQAFNRGRAAPDRPRPLSATRKATRP